MSAAPNNPHRVLVVDADARVRDALTELINAIDGYRVTASTGTPGELPRWAPDQPPTAAVVGIHPSSCRQGLTNVRALAARLPVVAVAGAASLRSATAAAGAAAFYEMDGNTERLIAALHAAAHRR